VDEAIACYKKAIALDPKCAKAHSSLGVALYGKGQVDDAIACYKKAIEADPKLAPAHSNLGIALDATGKQKEAIEAWREAIRLNPRFGEPQYRLGKALLLQGKPSEALGPLQAAANLLPDATARARHLSADLLAAARQALPEDSPQLAGILAQTGLDLLQQQKWTEAEPLLRQSLAIREKAQPDAWTTFNTKSLLGGALLGQKKYADAEPLLLQGYEGLKAREKTIPKQGGGERRLPEALDRLTALYTALNQPDEAKKWQAERAKYPETKYPETKK
jgi:tetratricopeptide (TPR) repeat protein